MTRLAAPDFGIRGDGATVSTAGLPTLHARLLTDVGRVV